MEIMETRKTALAAYRRSTDTARNGLLSGDFATFMRATPFGRVQKGMMFISTCACCHTSLLVPASTDPGDKTVHDGQSAARCRTAHP